MTHSSMPSPSPPPSPRPSADESALAETLVATGRLSPEQLAAALDAQRRAGGPTRAPLSSVLTAYGIDLRPPPPSSTPSPSASGPARFDALTPSPAALGRDLADAIAIRDAEAETKLDRPPGVSLGAVTPAPSGPGSSASRAAALDAEVASAARDPSRRIGRYVLLDELGRGGMGVVHRAFDPTLRRPVALKVVRELDAGDEILGRFVREAQAAARLRHPGIVSVHEVGSHEGRPFLAMELVAGATLEDALLDRDDPMTPRRLAEVVRDVARALHHAHDQGVLHRDVKPHNVIIDAGGAPHLTDFGLARDLLEQDQLTVSGQVLGTPAYMAPEQTGTDRAKQGPATDVYGLGAVLYRGLAGRPPFSAADGGHIFHQILFKDPEPPRRRVPSVHPDLETIALRCLEKEPGRRYPHAAELAAELDRFLDGEAITARPIGRAERARRWVRRNRLASAAIAAAAVGLIAAGVVVGVAWRNRVRADAERLRAVAEAVARERASARDAASREADRAVARFADARARALPDDAEARRRALDELLASGLAALETTSRAAALHPDDETVGARAVAAAIGLGEAAVAAEQWSVASVAIERARALGAERGSLHAAAAELAEARTRRAAQRRGQIEAVLDAARSGEAFADPGGRLDALMTLVGLSDGQTVALLAAALDEVTAALAAGRRELYLGAAEPDAVERAAGEGPIGDLVGAIEHAEARPWEAIEPEHVRALEAAGTRLVGRAIRRRRAGARAARIDLRALLIDAAEARVGRNQLELAALVADALGRIGITEVAQVALARYLALEPDPVRAVVAAQALCRLRNAEAEAIVMASASRFGDAPRYWSAVQRVLARSGGAAVDSAEANAPLDSAHAYRTRALLREAKGDLKGAIADMGRALALDADDPSLYHDRGLMRRRSGDADGAIDDATAAIERAPAIGLHWHLRATARLATGDAAGAVADWTRAVAASPTLSAAWNGRGGAFWSAGDRRRALADFQRAVASEPRNVAALGNLGMALVTLDRPAEALEPLDRAIETDPGYGRAYLHRGRARHRLGDRAGAERDLDRATELHTGDAEAWSHLGLLRLETGDLAGARAALERAAELAPSAPFHWHNLGRAQAALGQSDAAIAAYERAIAVDARFAASWLNRGNLLDDRGDLDEAERSLSRACELRPDWALAFRNRGLTREARDDLAGARTDYDRAIGLDPRDGELLFFRARVRRAAGDVEGARADLEGSLAIEPGHPKAGQAQAMLAELRDGS